MRRPYMTFRNAPPHLPPSVPDRALGAYELPKSFAKSFREKWWVNDLDRFTTPGNDNGFVGATLAVAPTMGIGGCVGIVAKTAKTPQTVPTLDTTPRFVRKLPMILPIRTSRLHTKTFSDELIEYNYVVNDLKIKS